MNDRDLLRRISRREVLSSCSIAAVMLGALGKPAAFGETSVRRLPEEEWAERREMFLLDRHYVHLNAASLGACPRVVVDARHDAERLLESNPAVLGYGELVARAEKTRAEAAAFLGCAVDEIVLTRNTTDGMNLVASGCALHPEDRILTTDHEHAGGLLCWETIARQRHAIVDRVTLPLMPRDEDEILSRFAKALTPRTKIVSVSHVTYTNGLVLPIARLAELLRPRDCLLIVDGAQAAGVIPVNLSELGCHAYATSGHKWLLGPKGTGILSIRRDARERITPLPLASGYGVYTGATGVPDLPALIALGTTLQWRKDQGIDVTFARLAELRTLLETALQSLPKVKIVSPSLESGFGSPILSLCLATGNSAAITGRLRDRDRICVRHIGRPSIDLRVSAHVYNSPEDLVRLAAALKAETES